MLLASCLLPESSLLPYESSLQPESRLCHGCVAATHELLSLTTTCESPFKALIKDRIRGETREDTVAGPVMLSIKGSNGRQQEAAGA